MKNNLSEDEFKYFEGMDEVYTKMENKRSENNKDKFLQVSFNC